MQPLVIGLAGGSGSGKTTIARTIMERVGRDRMVLIQHFVDLELRSVFDIKIFVDAPGDLRFIRRLQRDMTERERTPESVIRQYLETVRPMHVEFVEPTKRFADLILPEGAFNTVGVDVIVARVRDMLGPKG